LQQVKKFSFPILCFIGLTPLPELRFARPHSNLSFRLLISDANRRAIACAEAIRSVTHLVLAPGKQSSFSGLVLLFLHIKSFFVFSFSLSFLPAPIPSLRDQKTFSAVPCSFIWKELWFPEAF